ncbi:DedA family protein [Microbacterium sp. UFMG61]|uniref:DedA family protein n=1 Tax=Microbacterium sp. UFMG61 TaxID=2745935 RepID=UPI00188F3CA5|nr:VTT domain-containing protein [Microbacterium sp. UFMG61]
MDVINELILQTVASPWLFVVLLAVTIVDGFFPPVPSETVLVAAAAVLASTGDVWALLPLGLVAALGATIGDNLAFALGRRLGTTRWAWMRRPGIARAFAQAERALAHRSAALILGARYIPVGRVAVNMSAGALRFPWRRFVPLSIVAGISWSALSLAIGLLAGSWVRDQPLVSAAIGIAVALVIGLVIDRVTALRRRRVPVPQLAG